MKKISVIIVAITFFIGPWALAQEINAYKVGIEDVLDVSVIKPVPIVTRMTVTSDGTITFPYIGSVRVKGQTLPQIQSEIQNRLGNDMNDPVVSVSLWEARSKKFTVYGQVMHPGAYPVEVGMSVLGAISSAGGLSIPGSTAMVKVLRPIKDGKDKSVIFESDISAVLSGSTNDVIIQAGDTIVVTIDKFYIYGQIAHPGAYPVRDNMDIMYAVTMAAGFIQWGSLGRIKLFRANPQKGEAPIIDSDIKTILEGSNQRAIVRAGDTIVVSLDKFFVTGQVNHPGAYPVEEHMSLFNALSIAGGLTADNSTGKIKLLRAKANGGSAQGIETDFTSVLNGTAPDVSIRAFDTIVVIANKFYVFGEVTKPGMYSLEFNTTALTAISIAGGFSKFGSASRVKVLRMNENTQSYEILKVNIKEAIAGNPKADVLLIPGDVVVVSEGVF